MKKAIIIIIVIALLTAAAVYIRYRMRKPKISIEKIDWINKTVEYCMSYNGDKRCGIQSLEDGIITSIPSKDKTFTYYIKPIYGPEIIQFALLDEKNKIIVGTQVNFKDKSETPLANIIKE